MFDLDLATSERRYPAGQPVSVIRSHGHGDLGPILHVFHVKPRSADIGFHSAGIRVAELESEELTLAASNQRKLPESPPSAILVRTNKPAGAQQHTTEVAHHNHRDVLDTAQDLQHRLARGTRRFAIITGTLYRLSALLVNDVRAAMVAAVGVLRADMRNEIAGGLFRRCAGGQTDELGAFDFDLGLRSHVTRVRSRAKVVFGIGRHGIIIAVRVGVMDEAMIAGVHDTPANKNTYCVWAPRAGEMQLVVNGEKHPMTRDGEWFTSDVAPQVGDHYGFSIDGGDPIGDPCSRRQPDGIHGLSEHWQIDQPRSPINTKLAGQVLYELHVGTFTPDGTLDSAIEKLDYLAELGVTAVELMPVQPFGGARNWGYDGVYWHAVSEVYGGPDALVRFVDAAHDRGLAVILDVVYNHFGPDGAYGNLFGPYTAGGSTGWGEVVNLQGHGSDGVRKYILEAVRQWTQDFGIDGLRLDAVHAFDDTGAYSITEQIRDAAAPSFVIAETDQNDPKYTQQFGIAQWDDDIHHAIHAAVSGETHGYYADFGSAEVVAQTLKNGFWHDGKYSTFRGRTHGRALHFEDGETTEHESNTHESNTEVVQRHQLVTYTTTHDQTGNRARGDRPSMNLTGPQQVLKAALVLISPYTPMLFMGEEWGASTPFAFFVNHENLELNDATRAGRLREFARMGWAPEDVPDPAAVETFEASKLKWEERLDGDHARIAEAYRDLIAMRAQLGIVDAEVVEAAHGEGWVRMGYATEAYVVTVSANLSDATRLPTDGPELGPWEVRIDVDARDAEGGDYGGDGEAGRAEGEGEAAR